MDDLDDLLNKKYVIPKEDLALIEKVTATCSCNEPKITENTKVSFKIIFPDGSQEFDSITGDGGDLYMFFCQSGGRKWMIQFEFVLDMGRWRASAVVLPVQYRAITPDYVEIPIVYQ